MCVRHKGKEIVEYFSYQMFNGLNG